MGANASRLLRLAAAVSVSPPLAALVTGYFFLGTTILAPYVLAGVLWIAYPAMVLLGLPTHALLMWRNYRSVLFYAGAGALYGLVTTLALSFFVDPDIANAIAITTTACATCAVIFWLIRRPDRDAANPATSPP
jgi:hypothetical protein